MEGFVKYLDDYGNTICGRYPITLLLALLKLCKSTMQLDTQYDMNHNTFLMNHISYVSSNRTLIFCIVNLDFLNTRSPPKWCQWTIPLLVTPQV